MKVTTLLLSAAIALGAGLSGDALAGGDYSRGHGWGNHGRHGNYKDRHSPGTITTGSVTTDNITTRSITIDIVTMIIMCTGRGPMATRPRHTMATAGTGYSCSSAVTCDLPACGAVDSGPPLLGQFGFAVPLADPCARERTLGCRAS